MSLTAADAGTAPPRPALQPAPPSALAAALVVGVCGLTPVLAYLWSLGFAAVVALAGLLAAPLLFRSRRPSLGLAILLALTVWAVVSALWSVATPAHPDFSRYKAVEQFIAPKLVFQLALYGAFVAAAFRLSPRGGSLAALVLAVGMVLLALLFLAEAVLKAPLYQWIRAAAGQATRPDWAMRDVARSGYVLALLFWPAALRFSSRRLWPVFAAMAAAALVGAYLLNADAPFAALGVSTLVFLAVRFGGRPAVLAMAAAVVVYFLAAPLVVLALDQGQLLHPAPGDIRMQSWAIRLDIWRFATQRILEHPLWGWGLDAARTFGPEIPLHTHNAAIQVWLELGAVGALLTALFWAWVMMRVEQLEALDRPMAAAAAAAASAYLTIGALSFGVWQEWWLALGALVAVVCVALAKSREALHPPAGAGA